MVTYTDTDDLMHKNTHSGKVFLLQLAVNMFFFFFFFKLDLREQQVLRVFSQLFNPRICTLDEKRAN